MVTKAPKCSKLLHENRSNAAISIATHSCLTISVMKLEVRQPSQPHVACCSATRLTGKQLAVLRSRTGLMVPVGSLGHLADRRGAASGYSGGSCALSLPVNSRRSTEHVV